MQKVLNKSMEVAEPQSETDSEQEQFEDDENRLSDEEFPISEDEGDDSTKKKGWASSMAKVLNSDKSGVLSKAKKEEDVAKKKEKKSYTFEIDGGDSKKDEEKPSEKALKRALERRKLREKRENKVKVFNLRLKPSVADLDRERSFKKIATRGVVQLFNAVKSQQSEMDKKLQSTKLESKRDEIIKSSENKKNFLDNLMSGPRAKSEVVDKGVKKESSDDDDSEKESKWSALRDDFMTGKKTGWDNDDDDEEMEAIESDSD